MYIYTSNTTLLALTTILIVLYLKFFESFGTVTFFIRNRAYMYTSGYTTDKINISVDNDAVIL